MTPPRSAPQSSADAKSLQIDGHAHVFTTALPMAEGRRYTPREDALPERYVALLRDQNLDGVLLVQPSFLGTDNSYLLDVLAASRQAKGQPTLWGIAVLDPSTPLAEMRAMRAAGIVGVRLNCFSTPIPDLNGPEWSGHLERVEAVGWHAEVHIEGARLAPLIDRLQASNRRIVVDHFGLPDRAAPVRCPGFRRLLEDPDPGLCVKLSAPCRVFPDLPVAEAAAACGPLARSLLEAIGPERVIWGSDWPWTQHEKGQTYAQCRQWGIDWYRSGGAEPALGPEWILDPVPVRPNVIETQNTPA